MKACCVSFNSIRFALMPVRLNTLYPHENVVHVDRKWRGFHSHNGKQPELLLIKQMHSGRAPFRVTHREICCVCLTDCSVPSYHWVYERTKRVRARVKTLYWSSVGFNILTTSWKGRTAVLNVCWPGFGTRFHALCSDALANIQAVKPNSDHMTSLLRRLQAACYYQCFYYIDKNMWFPQGVTALFSLLTQILSSHS